ncbi:hypothetical protein E2C01_028997 [Portunus trituberculatus]|uniref:Uncharacterized protein n=1 Tax=Portunus trituberculatus TaxID=210409 RepID=A0A5B7EN07_PORTR|nr:hypothetical protein [Portunus trituberculatus]
MERYLAQYINRKEKEGVPLVGWHIKLQAKQFYAVCLKEKNGVIHGIHCTPSPSQTSGADSHDVTMSIDITRALFKAMRTPFIARTPQSSFTFRSDSFIVNVLDYIENFGLNIFGHLFIARIVHCEHIYSGTETLEEQEPDRFTMLLKSKKSKHSSHSYEIWALPSSTPGRVKTLLGTVPEKPSHEPPIPGYTAYCKAASHSVPDQIALLKSDFLTGSSGGPPQLRRTPSTSN